MQRMHSTALMLVAGAVAIPLVASAPAGAQTPKVYYACYVPSTGTVYRIKEPNTPQECGSSTKKGVTTQHIEFSWTDGAGALRVTDPAGGDLTGPLASPTVAKLLGRALGSGAPANGSVLTWDASASEWQAKAPAGGGGTTDHGSLTGLTDDDHPQYALADGVRNATNGFAITGTFNAGTIPISGAGARMMWYPRKAAFRAGYVSDVSDFWDDPEIGDYSTAMGLNARASGQGTVALGVGSTASGYRAAALGGGWATGGWSFAFDGNASGSHAVAVGEGTVASGERSVALGTSANTNGKTGAFVWSDASTPNVAVNAAAANQFVVRAAQFWFGSTNNVTSSLGRFIETSTGAYLSSGGTWTNSSDSAKKTGFLEVNGDSLLAKLAAMPVRTWSYRDEDSTVRHIGPTAQDFRAAFALGQTDRAIATVDADGVSLAAIKALVARTDELARENGALATRNERLSREAAALAGANTSLRADLESLGERVRQLEAALASASTGHVSRR